MPDYTKIRQEDMGIGSPIALERVDGGTDVDYLMAICIAETIVKNNEAGRPSMLILPVGPTGYAKRFAWIANRNDISLKNTTIINMDEYMWDENTLMEPSHPLSFKGFMDREFYGEIRPELNVPASNRIFPDPKNTRAIWDLIQKKDGGVDVCIGGIGLDGHIAFNEPPEEKITAEEFAGYPTRVLKVHYSTRVINSLPYGGNYDAMPGHCVTVGMKEILSAKKLRFFTGNSRNASIIRRILHGPVTPEVPASLMQRHPDCRLYCVGDAYKPPVI
ncbi:MAG: glucosamine-6-phosphate isomerase [Defluviitaleaceae bacterium]|nr:glucosamine-6-phosphate isomerase [Defluviitaleaceae bacterium]